MRSKLGIAVGTLIGLAIGVSAGELLASMRTYKHVQEVEQKLREAWVLLPVVVFNRDLPAGTTLDYDLVAQMSVPEQFATPNVVKPSEFEKVIGLELRIPVQKGDLVLLSMFAPTPAHGATTGRVPPPPTPAPDPNPVQP